jgi:hypothetical protein
MALQGQKGKGRRDRRAKKGQKVVEDHRVIERIEGHRGGRGP